MLESTAPIMLDCTLQPGGAVRLPIAARWFGKLIAMTFGALIAATICVAPPAAYAQGDPAEPAHPTTIAKSIARPTRAFRREDVDEKSMRVLDEQLVSCGTRHSLNSWEDPSRGPGCARDHILARLQPMV